MKAKSALFWGSLFLSLTLPVHAFAPKQKNTKPKQVAKAATQITIAFTHENYNFFNLFEEFSKQTGIKVQTAAFSSEDLKVELLQRADNNQLPDAVIVPADYIGLEEIEYSLIPPKFNSPYTDAALIDALRLDGHQYGVPIIAGNHLVLYYNKNYVSKPVTNWQQLRQTMPTLPMGVNAIGWSYNEMYWFLPFLTAFGEPPLTGHEIKLNTEGMRLGLAFYWQLAKDNVVAAQCDYQCSFQKFSAGKLAYMINGVWAKGNLSETFKDKLGITTLPDIGNKKMRPYYSAHVLAFPGNALASDKSASLEKLSAFFQSEQTQKKIWYELNSLPVHNKVLSLVKSTAGENELAIFKQLDTALPMPTTREMAVVWEAIGKGANRYMGEVLSLEKATEYMQYIADKTVDEFDH